ncbi:MAG: hypothetical protein LBP35_00190 [Candidatus Ancillula trichonymphae]|jgi:type I restriction enzyme M protein|nr:hypothetical protein [Candidatus Ancillula trichonymphae]
MINYNQTTRDLIDDLKVTCTSHGLGNDGNEYKVITQSFLYKFSNDKFIYDLKEKYPELKNQKNLSEYLGKMSEDDYLMKMRDLMRGARN